MGYVYFIENKKIVCIEDPDIIEKYEKKNTKFFNDISSASRELFLSKLPPKIKENLLLYEEYMKNQKPHTYRDLIKKYNKLRASY